MSFGALFIFAAVAMGQPAASPPVITELASEADRTPIRCRPAPYYVAEQGDRLKPQHLMITGSRVPMTARDYDRRPKPPCLLMRYEAPPNPLRHAD